MGLRRIEQVMGLYRRGRESDEPEEEESADPSRTDAKSGGDIPAPVIYSFDSVGPVLDHAFVEKVQAAAVAQSEDPKIMEEATELLESDASYEDEARAAREWAEDMSKRLASYALQVRGKQSD